MPSPLTFSVLNDYWQEIKVPSTKGEHPLHGAALVERQWRYLVGGRRHRFIYEEFGGYSDGSD